MRRSWFVLALLVYLGGLGFIQAQQNQIPRSLTAENRQTLQQVFSQHRTAAVRIETIPEGVGSGAFINDQGLVLTAYHVIRGMERLKVVTTNQQRFNAVVVGYDELRDLALIQAEVSGKVPFLPIETLTPARPGDLVVNIGNSRNGFISPRPGLVTALDKSIRPDFPAGMIASTMQLAPGDSGGPIINTQGRIIAVAVAIGLDNDPRSSYFVESYVAPLVGLQELIGQMSVGYRRDAPYIGIQVAVDRQTSTERRLPGGGVVVGTVLPGGAGARAGLRGENMVGPNELPDIILQVEGVAVNDFFQLVTEVRKKSVGDTVTLTIRREGRIIQIQLTLAPLPRNT